MGLRLGIDLGTNSLGWALLQDDGEKPVSVKKASVRIFSDGREPAAEGKTGDPLAVTRRIERGARRRRDRMLGRKHDIRTLLLEYGLFPSDPQEQVKLKDLNPYELRYKAVHEPLKPEELARALIHLSQRRGFKSNRKGDKTAEKKEEKEGQTKDREDLDKILKDRNITLGQYLWEELQKGEGTRARLGKAKYPQRAHYIAEFQKIHDTQKSHQNLTDEQWAKIGGTPQKPGGILFSQRDLAAQPKGKCQLYFRNGEERAPKALSSWQRFRISQNLTNLKIVSADRKDKTPLTKDQIETLNSALQGQGSMAFGKIIKLLKLPKDTEFNLESDRRKGLEGNKTSALLSQAEYFGTQWHDFSVNRQDEIILTILDTSTSEELIKVAVENWGCTQEQADAIDKLDETKFERGYGRFCQRALFAITDILMTQGISVTEALMQLRGNMGHNKASVLEYYGKVLPESMVPAPKSKVEDEKIYGKINNPTVHIALNQLRKVVNELIAEYGRPDEIIVELSRDLKLSQDAKDGLRKFQDKNQKKNDVIKDELVKHKIRSSTDQVTSDDLLRWKLWEELDAKDCNNRLCPYSGKKIGITDLYSNRVEVEHILPLTRTLDDSYRNKTVSFVEANRFKSNQTPYKAFTRADSPYSYDDILVQIDRLPHTKKRRFFADAMDVWEKKEGGFIARQLTDTQYLSKVAKKYLESLYDAKEGVKVRVLPGQLTAKLRHQWGLNAILAPNTPDSEEKARKNRNDHRHHAIDAIVVACTDQGLLQKASKASGRGRIDKLTFEPPWDRDQFFHDVKRTIEGITVSHKPDHGADGAILKGGTYGKTSKANPKTLLHIRQVEEKFDRVSRMAYAEIQMKNIGLGQDARSEKILVRDRNIRKQLLQKAITHPSVGDPKREEIIEKLLNLTADKEDKKILKTVSEDEFSKKVLAEPIEISEGKKKRILPKKIRILQKGDNFVEIRHPEPKTGRFYKLMELTETHNVCWWKLPDGSIHTPIFTPLFDANKKGCEKKPHAAAKKLLVLHKGDIVRIEKDGEVKTLRVSGLQPSQSQPIELVAHNAGGKSEDRQKIKLNGSPSEMKSLKVRKIFVTPAGKVHDSGTVF